jgi:hypothetical protein
MISSKGRARLSKAQTIRAGGDLNDSQVSLCVYSPSIDIARITSLLGCAPTRAHEKGQLSRPKSTMPSRIGLWALDAPSSLRFEEKIQYLLAATAKQPTIWKRLAAGHDVQLRCAIFLHSWNEGFELAAETVAELGKRGWKFSLVAYSAEGDEIVDALLTKSPRKQGR